MHPSVPAWRYATLLLLGTLTPLAIAGADPRAGATVCEDRLLAGSEQDFMLVRHLVLRGTNEAIGQALANIARERHGLGPAASRDPFRTHAQRRYVEKSVPILYQRMRGVAAAFGKSVDDDAWNFSALNYAPLVGGCSVIHLPPDRMASGTSVVSRDYDLTTGNLNGTRPRPGKLSPSARPYVIEVYPDHGYASLAVCCYDLLSGALDGINSEGLTVALLADDELSQKFKMEPAGNDGVGLGALQVARVLLDTCATVEEAKEALLLSKQYYEIVPIHYLVADRNGKSFVWEYSQAHNREFIVENPGRPLITTNFSLHRHLEDGKTPSATAAKGICPRYCILAEQLNGHADKLTLDSIKQTHSLVDQTRGTAAASRLPNRTLWHALYFPEQRKVQVSFYLKDVPDPDQPGKAKIVRSDYVEFTLDDRNVKPREAAR
jgi:hypothetical protein